MVYGIRYGLWLWIMVYGISLWVMVIVMDYDNSLWFGLYKDLNELNF